MQGILVTGGAGFIGSNFIRYFLKKYEDHDFMLVNLDKLTYAGNLSNLQDIQDARYRFVRGDICDRKLVEEVILEGGVDTILNFAAESHVDRSIHDPSSFITTDVLGTCVLLEAARKCGVERYLQVSTDEVYGSIENGSFREEDPLDPSSPYSASKAGGDLLVKAYHKTYGLPVVITRSSNNYGPYQHPEKLIPRFITNAIQNHRLPLYGDGLNMRDWLYVEDNCEAIDLVLHQGEKGEIYNIGSGVETTNLEITRLILEFLGKSESLIEYVKDRPGHDRRYSLDTTKIRKMGWKPKHRLQDALAKTVKWYQDNRWWWQPLVKEAGT